MMHAAVAGLCGASIYNIVICTRRGRRARCMRE
eukprot:COSAG02_NODE_42729_length_381_cov_37.943262_1_plen_32_part_01